MDFLEHFFFRIEIVANEIEKVIRFAKIFPLGHKAWKRYNSHPIRPFLKYFRFPRKWPPEEYDDTTSQESSDSEDEGLGPTKRRRTEYDRLNSSPTLPKRVCIHEALNAEPEIFEDARESQP